MTIRRGHNELRAGIASVTAGIETGGLKILPGRCNYRRGSLRQRHRAWREMRQAPIMNQGATMPELTCDLTAADKALLLKNYAFYRELASGARMPTTEMQRRFVAVSRGELPPTSEHELAYCRFRDFLAVRGIDGSELVTAGFRQRVSFTSIRPTLTQAMLERIPTRKRAVLKLRTGCGALTELELRKVLPDWRHEASEVRPRSLREVGMLFGVSRERIRQLQNSALKKIGLLPLG